MSDMINDSEADETKTYCITVTRQIAQSHHFEVEAENEDEARELAEDELLNIGDDDWDDEETTGDPEILTVTELTDENESPEEDDAA